MIAVKLVPSEPRRQEHIAPAVVQDLLPKTAKERGVAWRGADRGAVAVIWFPTAMIQISASELTFRGWEFAQPFVQLTPARAAEIAQGLRASLELRTHVCACGRIHDLARHQFVKKPRQPRRTSWHERSVIEEYDSDNAPQHYFFTVTHEPQHDEFRFVIHAQEDSATRAILLTAEQLGEVAAALMLIADGHRPFRCAECTKPIADAVENR